MPHLKVFQKWNLLPNWNQQKLLNYTLKIKQLLPEGNLLEPCGIHNSQVNMKLPRKSKSNKFKVPVASKLINWRHTKLLIVNINFLLNTMLRKEIQLRSLPLSLIQVPNRYHRSNHLLWFVNGNRLVNLGISKQQHLYLKTKNLILKHKLN